MKIMFLLFFFFPPIYAQDTLVIKSLVPIKIETDTCYAIRSTYIYAVNKEYTQKSRKENFYQLLDSTGVIIKEPKEFKVIGAPFLIPPRKKAKLKKKLREQGIDTSEFW